MRRVLSEDSVSVHRLVQDIIKEEVLGEEDLLKQTLENVTRLLVYAVENGQDPEECRKPLEKTGYFQHVQTQQMALLQGWALVMENTVSFIRELVRLKMASSLSEHSAPLLDHSVLYFFVLNQTDSSAEFSAMLEKVIYKMPKGQLYWPKFPLPNLRVQDKELISQLAAPMNIRKKDGETPLTIEQAESAKAEGDAYSKQNKHSLAIQAYSITIEDTSPSHDIWIKTALNFCVALCKTEDWKGILDLAQKMLAVYPQDHRCHFWMLKGYAVKLRGLLLLEAEKGYVRSKEHEIEIQVCHKMMRLHASLSMHFNKNGSHDKYRCLVKKEEHAELSPVTEISSSQNFLELFSHVIETEYPILLFNQGIHQASSLLRSLQLLGMVRCSTLVGDFSDGNKPTLYINDEAGTINLPRPMLVANLNLKMENVSLRVQLLDAEECSFFVNCSFKSFFPLTEEDKIVPMFDDNELDSLNGDSELERVTKTIQSLPYSVEEHEMRGDQSRIKSFEQKALLDTSHRKREGLGVKRGVAKNPTKYMEMKERGKAVGAAPALAVTRGIFIELSSKLPQNYKTAPLLRKKFDFRCLLEKAFLKNSPSLNRRFLWSLSHFCEKSYVLSKFL